MELGPADAKTAEADAANAAALAAEPLVHLVRDDVEFSGDVAVQAVVARTRPVAVAVDERDFHRQESEGTVDVEERGERRLQLVHGCLIQHLAQLRERLPRL